MPRMGSEKNGQGTKRYPWKKWLKLMARPRGLTLEQGKDFTAMPHSMSQQVRNAAQRFGYAVSIKVLEKSIEAKSRKLEESEL